MYNIRLYKYLDDVGVNYAEYENESMIEFNLAGEFYIGRDNIRYVVKIDNYSKLIIQTQTNKKEYDLESENWKQELAYDLYNRK